MRRDAIWRRQNVQSKMAQKRKRDCVKWPMEESLIIKIILPLNGSKQMLFRI